MYVNGEKLLGLSSFKEYKTAVLTALLIFCSAPPNNAQSIESILGNVVNSSGEAQTGNALIVSPIDSTILTGTSFFEGRFILENLNAKRVLLKLTSLEFQDAYFDLQFEGRTKIDLGNIRVEEASTELEEVVLVTKTPIAKQRPDGSIEVKVENTSLATSTSVNEILTRSPGVVLDEENAISIFGKGVAVIFINYVRVSNERLSTLSPSNIRSIEIISNPGPRFDSEGNAVINIITKRNTHEGSKGFLKNYYTYSDFAGGMNRTEIDYSYLMGRWAINGNYGLQFGKDRFILRTSRTREEQEDFFDSNLETEWQYEMNNFSNYGFGVQYEISKSSNISLQYTGASENLGGGLSSENRIIDDQIGIYNSSLDQDDRTLKNAFNGNYFKKVDSLGSNLFMGTQYSSYKNDFNNDISQSNVIDGIQDISQLNNIGENNINILSIQSDFTKVFQKGITLELGLKYGYVNVNSNTIFSNIDNIGNLIRDDELSSSFEYVERVPAGYISFKGKIKEKVNYGFGLRSELTDYDLFTSIDGGEIIEDNYINFFPNASIDVKWSDKIGSYISYSSRIRRPPYNRLNPFVVYQDEFTSIRGNADLQPSMVHSIELGGNYHGWSLKTGYNYTIEPITGGAFQSQENPREYILQQVNVSEEHAYFATLSKSVNLKWWQSINNVSISYNKLIDNEGIFDIRNSEPYYYIYSQNSFEIRNGMSFYVTAWYLSDKLDGIKLRKSQSSINLGLEKKLFDDKLTLNLDFNDIFYRTRADGNYRIGITDVIYANQLNTNYFRLSLAYNFGKLKKSKYHNKNVGESENERI